MTQPSASGAVTGGVDTPPPRNKALLKVVVVAVVILLIGGVVWIATGLFNQNKASEVEALQEDEPVVSIGASGFSPATIKVKVNQEITWTNEDVSQHQLLADETELPGFDSIEPLINGDSYTYIFETTGTFHYYDPHDTTFFKGTVVVE